MLPPAAGKENSITQLRWLHASVTLRPRACFHARIRNAALLLGQFARVVCFDKRGAGQSGGDWRSARHGDGQWHQHQLYADGRLRRPGQLYLYCHECQRHVSVR